MSVEVADLQELGDVSAEQAAPAGCCGFASIVTCPASTFQSIFCVQ